MDSLRTMLLCVPAVRTQWHCRRAAVGSLNFSISFRFRYFDWRFQPTVGGSNQRLEVPTNGWRMQPTVGGSNQRLEDAMNGWRFQPTVGGCNDAAPKVLRFAGFADFWMRFPFFSGGRATFWFTATGFPYCLHIIFRMLV